MPCTTWLAAVVRAPVSFQEKETGSIVAGKAADLIVLDHDLTAIPPTQIHSTRVLLTLLEGKAVFGDPAALRAP